MAGKIFKAGIRFNDPKYQYMSFIFNVDESSCTVFIHGVLKNKTVILKGHINNWVPVDSESLNSNLQPSAQAPAANTVRTTRTTAKKAVKGE